MKKKGQISFDFLMAILGFIAIAWFLQTTLTDFQLNQGETSIRFQQKNIALSISEIVSSARSLEGENFTIKFKVPYISTPGSEKIDCSVDIQNSKIIITSGNISEEIPFRKPNVNISNSACGQTLEVANI